MPNCQVYHRWMSLKLDGLLNREQERALQTHLATCAECRAEWQAMQFVSHLLSEQPMLSPLPGFAARVKNSLAAKKAARQRGIMGAMALILGALSLSTLALSPLAGIVAQIWPLLKQPSLWEGLVDWFGQFADVSLATGHAIALLLTSLFNATGGPVLLAYMLLVLLLTMLWSRFVLRRVRAYQPAYQ